MGYTLRLLASFILVFIIILEISTMVGYVDGFTTSGFIHENVYQPLAYAVIVYADRVTTPRVDYTPTQTEEPKSDIDDKPVTPKTAIGNTFVPSTELKPGITNDNVSIPSVVTDPVYVYSFSDIPDYVGSPETLKSAVYQAFESWDSLNDDISFVESELQDPDVVIIWEQYSSGDHIGQYNTDGTILITLGGSDCNGEYALYALDTLENTATHEIGHFLGLGHTDIESHLMYGPESPDPDPVPFDRYVIPEPVVDFSIFAMQQEIGKQMALVDEKIEIRKERIRLQELNPNIATEKFHYSFERRLTNIGVTLNDDGSLNFSEAIRSDDGEYDYFLRELGKIDSKSDIILNDYHEVLNSLILEYNELVEQYNCY